MGNQSANKEFANVCRNLEMSQDEASGFHRYLANNYGVEKDSMGYQELLKVGVEYLRNDIRREPPYQYRDL